jgi:hypothetical protein
MKRFLLVAAVFLCARIASADCSNGSGTLTVHVEPSNGLSSCSVTSVSGGKFNISLTRSTSVQQTVVLTIASTNGDAIHNLSITNESAYVTWVYVGASTARMGSIDSVARFGSGNGAVSLIELYTSSDLGVSGSGVNAVDVDTANTIDVLGDVFTLVKAKTGSIESIHSTGTLYGGAEAANGAIGTIDCTGNVSQCNIDAKTGIGYIRCATCYANINTRANGGTGALGYLETTSGGFPATVFNSVNYGSLNTYHISRATTPAGLSIAGTITAPLTIAGNVYEPITVSGDVDSLVNITGTIQSDVTFSIRDRLLTGTGHAGEIRVGASGLAGQIIINAGNSYSNAWGGPVKVNGTALSGAPFYTNTSSSIGGGSVGQAPYHLHDEDCEPENGYSGDVPLDNLIRLHWYGPLTWTSGDPVTVEYYSGGTWHTITSWFSYAINPSNPRELVITPLSILDWAYAMYRFKPTSNLKCGGVTTSPAVYDMDSYIVEFYY